MKKLAFIAFILLTVEVAFCQTTRSSTPGFVPRANQTIVVEDGDVSARNSLFVPRFVDSTEANVYVFKDSIGNVFFNYATNSIWVRVSNGSGGRKWSEIGTGSGGGGSGMPIIQTIPSSAFANPLNFTVAEANAYITATYGTDTGFFQANYDTIPVIDRREVVPNNTYYNAFPIIVQDPFDGLMYMSYQVGTAHVSKSAPAVQTSNDGGKTWSTPVLIVPASQTSDYKAPVMGIRNSDRRLYLSVDNGIANGLGLNPRIATIYYSDDRGLTFDTAALVDMTAEFAYRLTTSSGNGGRIYVSPDGSYQLMTVYGLDANNTNFEAGVIRSTNWFTAWTYIPFTQTAATDKFNEAGIIEIGDSLICFIRSEGAVANYYRSYSLNDGVTWSTPAAITVNGNDFRSRPDVSILPNGNLLFPIRMTSGNNPGGLWTSADNGLTFNYRGRLYQNDAGFLYSSSITVGNKVLMAYSRAPDGVEYTSGEHAGIYLATVPTQNSALWYRSGSVITTINNSSSPAIEYEQYIAWLATSEVIKAAPKPISIGTDSTSTATLLIGGKIEVGNGTNLQTGNLFKGVASSTFSNSQLQGAMSLADTVASIDTFVTNARHTSGTVANGKIFLGNLFTSTNIVIYDPVTGDTTLIPVGAVTHTVLTVGNNVVCVPHSGTKLIVIDAVTNDTANYTLPSAGWNGGANYSLGVIWSCKRTSTDDILQIDPKTWTITEINAPEAGPRNVGVFDGRYQWFTPASATHFLKVDKDDVFDIVNDALIWVGSVGDFKNSIMRGSQIWHAPATGNVALIFDCNTYKQDTMNLPSGVTYEGIVTDGPSIYFIGKSANTVVKVNPETKEYKVIQLAGASVATYNVGAIMYNNKIYVIGDLSLKLTSIETIELGADLITSKTPRIEFLDSISDLRALVFTTADARASISLTTSGSSGPATYNSSTGVLNVPEYTGGGGMTNPMTTLADMIVGGASGTPARLAAGTANQLLGMNNAGNAQEYKTFSVNSTAVSNDIGLTLSGANAIVLGIPDVSSTVRGVVTTGTQTIAGNKTLSGSTFLTGGFFSATSAATSNFGVGTNTTATTSTQTELLFGGASTINYRALFRGSTSTVAGVGNSVTNIIVGSVATTEAGSGVHAINGNIVINPQSIANGTATTTDAASLIVAGAPTGTATITNPVNAAWIYNGYLRLDGGLRVDQTITAGGTTGNQTINKAAGTVNIAAAGTTVTVTSSFCTTSSTVYATIRTNDATATIKNVVPGAGSFVINLGASATAEISIGWLIVN